MLPSGYLIRPCEGGGSIIHIVDHMDLEVYLFNCIFYRLMVFYSYLNFPWVVFKSLGSLLYLKIVTNFETSFSIMQSDHIFPTKMCLY